MTDIEKRKLIWADDDTRLSLRLMRGLLEKRGLLIETFSDSRTAQQFIESLTSSDVAALGEISLLADVILPKDPSGKAASPYIGFDLAEFACQSAIGSVGFLTVIQDQEMESKLRILKNKYPDIPIRKFDKLQLLEPRAIDEMADFLRKPK